LLAGSTVQPEEGHQLTGALIHEWLEPSGGAEKVLDAFASMFPHSDMYVLWNDDPRRYPDHQVYESWLSRTPLRHHKAASIPFLLPTWRTLRSSEKYDWLLISSHLFSHHARFLGVNRDIPKYVYAHTPARYIWTPELDQRGSSPIMRAASSALKPIDRQRAQEAYKIAANSNFVKERIENTWGREATVIYPPVNIEMIQSVSNWADSLVAKDAATYEMLPNEFVLCASRFVPYKRLDWAILAADRNDIPVVVAGSGPELSHLKEVADTVRVPVTFVLAPSTPLLYVLYQRALAYIFPAIEDFGIMPVEAQALGTPVVTTCIGGATETHIEGVTGWSAGDDSVIGLAQALARALSQNPLSRHTLQQSTSSIQRFSNESFRANLLAWMAG
jgi:glycosyltransferase involved in cell wall biosynthesis